MTTNNPNSTTLPRPIKQDNWEKHPIALDRSEENKEAIYRIPPPGNTHPPHSQTHTAFTEERSSEAKESIYRIPPPGNTTQAKQPRITKFYKKAPTRTQRGNKKRPNRRQRNQQKGTIRILQWNACSLSEDKARELQQLAIEQDADLLLISELGHRRKIPQYTQYTAAGLFTDSAIFWHATDNAATKAITPTELAIFENTRITTQIVELKEQPIVAHPYIPPDTSRADRSRYWRALDQWLNKQQQQRNRTLPIAILGDLNTPRDRRLGATMNARY